MRQILRGAGYLPHVGSHPGWPFLLVMIAAGCAAGAQGSGTTIGAAVGAVLMTVTVGPIFAIGCMSRANLSDRMESKQYTSSQMVGDLGIDADTGKKGGQI